MTGNRPLEPRPARSRTWYQAFALMSASLVFLGAMAGGVMVLHKRAGANTSPDANPPLVVNVRPVNLNSSYNVKERFVGVLEPARQTQLSFERSGLVTEVLLEEGDQVSQGGIVARLDTSRLSAKRRGLEAKLDELQAQHDLVTVTLSRQRTLAKKGWQSEQKYDEVRFRAAEQFSAIQRVEAEIDLIDVEIAKSELKAPYQGTVAARSIDEGSVVNV